MTLKARIKPSTAVEETLWGDENFSFRTNSEVSHDGGQPTLIDARFPSTVRERSVYAVVRASPVETNLSDSHKARKGNRALRGLLSKLRFRNVNVDAIEKSERKRDYRHANTATTAFSSERGAIDDQSISSRSIRTTRVQVDGENLLIRQNATRKLERAGTSESDHPSEGIEDEEEQFFPYNRSISRRYLVRRISSLTNASQQSRRFEMRRLADWGDPFFPTGIDVNIPSMLTDDESSDEEEDAEIFEDNLSTMSDPSDILFVPSTEVEEVPIRAQDDIQVGLSTMLHREDECLTCAKVLHRSASRSERRFCKQDSEGEVSSPISSPRRSLSSDIPRPSSVDRTARVQTYSCT